MVVSVLAVVAFLDHRSSVIGLFGQPCVGSEGLFPDPAHVPPPLHLCTLLCKIISYDSLDQ
jgi:hypothetical protein